MESWVRREGVEREEAMETLYLRKKKIKKLKEKTERKK